MISISTDTAEADNAITAMRQVLQNAGHTLFDGKGVWENCLCALILALEPNCKTYRVLEALPHRQRHLDKLDALNTMAHLGYFGRAVDITLQDIDPRLLPCLFIDENNMPVVVLEEHEDIIKLYDKSGIRRIHKEKICTQNGHIWLFERFDEHRPATSKFMRDGSGHSWFRALLRRFRGTFGQVLVTGLFLNIIALATPLYIMLVYDRVIAAGTVATLPMLVVGAAIAIAFEWVLRGVRSRGLSWLAARMDNIVGNKIFAHLISLPPSLIEHASVATQIARIKTFESVRDFFSGSVFLSMLEMPFVVIAALAIYALAGQLVFVPLTICALYGVLFFAIQRKVHVAIRLAAKTSSARQQFAIETFEKIKGIRGYGLSTIWQAKFRELSGREMAAHFRLNWLGMMAETFAHALTLLAAVTTVGFGVHFIWSGQMSTGALVATMILVWRILTPFYSMCTMIPRLEQIRNSIMQVNKLMDIDTEATEAKTSARLGKIQGRINFNHVGLRYNDDNDPVLEQLTFEARPGDLVAVTGENGAGKTTMLKLIKGLYTAQNGAVQIDGFDIRQLDAPDLRRQIAYVPQQSDFFHGSVLENLRLGNPLASESDVQSALQLADAWEDVVKLPQGLHTIVGKYGIGALPSGFATRLSLARAYLHTAPILLIDELPNALLSGATGKNLKEYLLRIKGKRTSIMVTYREDFMQLADTIISLHRGELPSVGEREKMLNVLYNKEAA